MTFKGFPPAAVTFYEGLQADNSRTYWQANKGTFDSAVKGPMRDLLDALEEFGPFHVFRPNRDVRFSKEKTPYKEHIGAFGESEGGAGFYVQFSAAGMFAGSGYYAMASDQLTRFREAVDADATGRELERIANDVVGTGLRLGAISELKTAPRGVAKDHPRISFMRRKGLFAGREWPAAKWMQTSAVVGRVRDVWQSGEPLREWLDLHVGPSTLPPDDYDR